MDYTLHIGVDPKHLNALTRLTYPLPHDVVGDGWNCWGEAIDTDCNDDRTLHVTFPLEKKKHARLMLGVLASKGIPLVPMSGYERQGGILAVLTDTADYGALDGVEHVTDSEGKRVQATRLWYAVCPNPDCGRDHHPVAR